MRLYPRVFAELNRRGVRYVVVGGLAVLLHGHPRLTMDADIIVDLDHDNALEAIRGLKALGFSPRVPVDPELFASDGMRKEWIEQKHMMVFSMADPANPFFAVDLFIDPPLPYEEIALNAIDREVDGVTIHVCSYEDLKRMKLQSGRPEDLSDIQALEDLRRGN